MAISSSPGNLGLADIWMRPAPNPLEGVEKFTDNFTKSYEDERDRPRREALQALQMREQQAKVGAAEYNNPNRQATPTEQRIGGSVLHMLNGPPEYKARLAGELGGQQGLGGAPMSSQSAPDNGPDRGALGPASGLGRSDAPPPQMQQAPQASAAPSINLTQPQRPQAQAPAGALAEPAPQMSRGDYDATLQAIPAVKSMKDDSWRQDIEREKLKQRDTQFSSMQDFRNRALQQKADLAKIMAQVRQSGQVPAEQKIAIERAKIALGEYAATVGGQSRVMGGLYGMVDTPGTAAMLGQLQDEHTQHRQTLLQAQDELERLQQKVGSAPTSGGRTVSVSGPQSVVKPLLLTASPFTADPGTPDIPSRNPVTAAGHSQSAGKPDMRTRMQQLKAQGLSNAAIAAQINKEGY